MSSLFNRRWATLLLEILTRHGVHHICIAPGSRSTPLTLAAATHARVQCHTHFDERGLGHLALGLAKASGQPVAVIVTSGTAAANLYPALIEASLTGEKLILLTADRPPELIDCGANQAIRQRGLFAGFAGQQIDLPRPTADIPARWLVSTLDHALGSQSAGGIHINCPFAEPLYGPEEQQPDPWSAALGDWWHGEHPWLQTSDRHPAVVIEPDWLSWRTRKAVVIAGRMTAQQGQLLAEWAALAGWPLIGDVLSQTGQPLPHADLWLANPRARRLLDQAELVVQFGSSLTGKRLLNWQASAAPDQYWLVDPLPGRLDPSHHQGRRISADIGQWLAAHPTIAASPWAAQLTEFSSVAAQQIGEALDEHLGEAQLAHHLPGLLPADGQLFVGNSLLIRLIDALAQLPQRYPVYANRGASGIDGLLSTAAGTLRATGRRQLMVLGDLSALYDLNALALFRHCPAPAVILVVNNNGGQIFSLLPTDSTLRQQFYVMPQQVGFRHAAAMFGLTYHQPADLAALQQCLQQAWQQPAMSAATLIELVVPDQEGAALFGHLVAQMAAL